MIVQWFIDQLCQTIAYWFNGLPQMPDAAYTARGWLVSGGAYLNGVVSNFGILVPFDAWGQIVTAWLGCVAWWLVMMGVKAILWSFNR